MLSFPQITARLLEELPSEASRRVYRNTFQQWKQFADYHDFNVLELFSDNIKRFLHSRLLGYSTRLSRKSHLQRLVRFAAHVDSAFGIHYVQLRDLKTEETSKDRAPRGKSRKLSNSECGQLLSVWKGDDSHMGIRHNAVLFLLLYASVQTIGNIVKQAAEMAGLGKLACLDLRRASLGLFSTFAISQAGFTSSADG